MSEIPGEELEEMRETLEEQFEDFKGRYKRDSLHEKLKELTGRGVNSNEIPQFREYMNENATFSILKQSGASSAGYSVRRGFEERMEQHSQDVDSEFRDAFYELVANGCSPDVAKMTIEYLTSDKTHQKVGDKYGVVDPGASIRHNEELARYLLPEDKIVGASRGRGPRLSTDPVGGLKLSFEDEEDEVTVRQLAVSKGWRTKDLAKWVADKAQEELTSKYD